MRKENQDLNNLGMMDYLNQDPNGYPSTIDENGNIVRRTESLTGHSYPQG